MQDYIPKIQDQLRRMGYPGFKRAQSQELMFGPKPQVVSSTRWLFSERENRTAVVISPDSIVLETSKYETFDIFSKHLLAVLEIVGKAAEVTLSERIGLRYINLIRPDNGDTLQRFLNPGLHGLPADSLQVKKNLYRFESRGATDLGQLVVKLLQTDNGSFLPPDLETFDLLYDVSIKNNEVVTLLDIDHYSTAQRDFEPSDLVESMWSLHDYTDGAFRAAVTEFALQKWGVSSS